jgi:hypothetical protein
MINIKSFKKVSIYFLFVILVIFLWWLIEHQLFYARTLCNKARLEKVDYTEADFKTCLYKEFFIWHPIYRFR